MAYLTEWVLVGSLTIIGVVAASYQDFLKILSYDWRHWLAVRTGQRRKRKGIHSSKIPPHRSRTQNLSRSRKR